MTINEKINVMHMAMQIAGVNSSQVVPGNPASTESVIGIYNKLLNEINKN